MGDSSSSQSFLRRHWEGYKESWGERFSFCENYFRFLNRDKPLPSWSSSDGDEFIASDPVHGPVGKAHLERSGFDGPWTCEPLSSTIHTCKKSVKTK